MQEGKKGKFIVIDGIDGSGKATQAKKLKKHFIKEGLRVESIDYPRYYDNVLGKFIGECLNGEHGDFAHLDPKIASMLYAVDRFESKEVLERWLEDGVIVIADRYVSANQIHQGGKIKDHKEREKFLTWLDKVEYEVLKLPQPDLTVFLDVDIEYIHALLQKSGETKKYAGGAKDVVEHDVEYLTNAQESARYLAGLKDNWIRVDCVSKGALRSIEDIHNEVYKKTVEHLSLPIEKDQKKS